MSRSVLDPGTRRRACECGAPLDENGRCPVCSALRAPHARRRAIEAVERDRERHERRRDVGIIDVRRAADRVVGPRFRPR